MRWAKLFIQNILCARNVRSRFRVVVFGNIMGSPIVSSITMKWLALNVLGASSSLREEVYIFDNSISIMCKNNNYNNNWLDDVVIPAASRKWCETHFSCIGCDKNMALPGSKYLEWDTKIMCMKCYNDIPSDVRKKLLKYMDIEKKAMQKLLKNSK